MEKIHFCTKTDRFRSKIINSCIKSDGFSYKTWILVLLKVIVFCHTAWHFKKISSLNYVSKNSYLRWILLLHSCQSEIKYESCQKRPMTTRPVSFLPFIRMFFEGKTSIQCYSHHFWSFFLRSRCKKLRVDFFNFRCCWNRNTGIFWHITTNYYPVWLQYQSNLNFFKLW